MYIYIYIYIYGHFFLKVPLLGKNEKTPERLCFGSLTQKSPYFYIVDDLRSQTYNFLFFLAPMVLHEKKNRICNFSMLNHNSQDWRLI